MTAASGGRGGRARFRVRVLPGGKRERGGEQQGSGGPPCRALGEGGDQQGEKQGASTPRRHGRGGTGNSL